MKKSIVCAFLLLGILSIRMSFAQDKHGCDIKGITDPAGQKIYLLPGHTLYDKIGVREEEGERWFCTEKEAEKAKYMFLPDPKNPGLRPATDKPTPTPRPTPPPEEKIVEEMKPVDDASSSSGEEQPPVEIEPSQEAPAVEETARPAEPKPKPESQPQPAMTPIELPQDFGMYQQDMPLAARILRSLPPSVLLIIGIVAIVFFFVMIVSMWRIFSKAGQPGFGALIPIYYNVLRFRVAGMSGWWFFSLFIPVIGQIIWFLVVPFKTASNFGKGSLYALGLILLPFLFYPHLAFSSAEYVG